MGYIMSSPVLPRKKQPYMRSIGDENIRSKEFCAKAVAGSEGL